MRLYAHRSNSYPTKTNSWYWIYGLLRSGTFQTSRFSRMQKWKYKFVPSINSCWRWLIWIAIFTIGMNSYPSYHHWYEFVPEILPLVRILTHYHRYKFLPKLVQIRTQDTTVSTNSYPKGVGQNDLKFERNRTISRCKANWVQIRTQRAVILKISKSEKLIQYQELVLVGYEVWIRMVHIMLSTP